jgi:Uma2 family endonuclease
MSRPAERLAEYRDLFDLPDAMIGEILHGQLIAQPRPAPRHARASAVIGDELGPPYDLGRGGGPGGWWILDEPELHLGRHILVPDLAGWRRERMPFFPDTAYFDLAPDWACEVLSPGTARVDRVIKMPIYAEQAVQWLWLVEPDLRTLEVFRLCEGHWMLEGAWQENDTVRAPPFDAIAIPLGGLWAPMAPQAGAGEVL